MSDSPFDIQRIASLELAPRISGDPAINEATLKQHPEDFVVEEIPAYEPSGSGEHLLLWVRKRDVSTEQLRAALAKGLGVPSREIGIAGNKDKRAVTRQWVSVPGTAETSLGAFTSDDIQVLESARHGNKLRTGHLRGNRFDILLRAESGHVNIDACEHQLQRLRTIGFANYYGTQRFGRGETLQLGLDIIAGRRSRRAVTRAKGRTVFRLALSAVQSAVFNTVVAERVGRGLEATVLPGDVLMFRDRRTHFRTEDPAAEQQRVDAGELVITGPIFGPKMTAASNEAAELEQSALAAMELDDEVFSRYPKMTVGTRRPLLRWPGDLSWQFESEGLRVQFTLDSGTYATVFLRELVQRLTLAG